MVEADRKLVMFVTNVCPSKRGVQETVGAREEGTHVEGTALGTIKQENTKTCGHSGEEIRNAEKGNTQARLVCCVVLHNLPFLKPTGSRFVFLSFPLSSLASVPPRQVPTHFMHVVSPVYGISNLCAIFSLLYKTL
jgi:hypothetical protein